MTIREYLEYADIYPYSKERFDLQKEIMQLDLAEIQLESYDFMNSNKFTIHQVSHLMTESTSIDMYNQLEAMYTEGVSDVIAKIISILKRIAIAIKNYIKKGFKTYKLMFDYIMQMKNQYKNNEYEHIPLSDDQLKRINQILILLWSDNLIIEILKDHTYLKEPGLVILHPYKNKNMPKNKSLIPAMYNRVKDLPNNTISNLSLVLQFCSMIVSIENNSEEYTGPQIFKTLPSIVEDIKKTFAPTSKDELITKINAFTYEELIRKIESANHEESFNLKKVIKNSGLDIKDEESLILMFMNYEDKLSDEYWEANNMIIKALNDLQSRGDSSTQLDNDNIKTKDDSKKIMKTIDRINNLANGLLSASRIFIESSAGFHKLITLIAKTNKAIMNVINEGREPEPFTDVEYQEV